MNDHLTTEKAGTIRQTLAVIDAPGIIRRLREYVTLPLIGRGHRGRLIQSAMRDAASCIESLIANQENLLGSEPEPTLASERVSERTGLQPSKE